MAQQQAQNVMRRYVGKTGTVFCGIIWHRGESLLATILGTIGMFLKPASSTCTSGGVAMA